MRGPIRSLTVIVCCHHDRVPRKHPKFFAKAIRACDQNRCQYTGRILALGEGSIDRVLPCSRGGTNSFENAVYAATEINHRKADRTP